MAVLPKHFKHSNFSSFVRQLNTYGFRKIDADRWEFANEKFQQGKKHLLKDIQRRRSPPNTQISSSGSSSAVMENPGLKDDVEKLRRDGSNLMDEVVKLRNEQLMAIKHMNSVKQRMESAEQWQKLMASFLVKVLQNPCIIENLKDTREWKGIASERVRRKFLKQKIPEESDLIKHMVENRMAKYSEFDSVESSALFGLEDSVSRLEEQPEEQDLFYMEDKDQADPTAVELFSVTESRKAETPSPPLADPCKGKGVIGSDTRIIGTGLDIEEDFPGLADIDARQRKDVRRRHVDTGTSNINYSVPQQNDISSNNTFTDVVIPLCESADIPPELWNMNFHSQDGGVWGYLTCSSGQVPDIAAGYSPLWDLGVEEDVEDLQYGDVINQDMAYGKLGCCDTTPTITPTSPDM